MMTNKQMIENKHNKVHCPQNTPVPPVLTPCTTRLLGWRHLQSHSLIYLISTSELYTLLNAILMAPKSNPTSHCPIPFTDLPHLHL